MVSITEFHGRNASTITTNEGMFKRKRKRKRERASDSYSQISPVKNFLFFKDEIETSLNGVNGALRDEVEKLASELSSTEAANNALKDRIQSLQQGQQVKFSSHRSSAKSIESNDNERAELLNKVAQMEKQLQALKQLLQ
jgi:chromosome segregation ATPase